MVLVFWIVRNVCTVLLTEPKISFGNCGCSLRVTTKNTRAFHIRARISMKTGLVVKGQFSGKHQDIKVYRSGMPSFFNQFVNLDRIIEIQFFKCQKWIPHTILHRYDDPIFFSTFIFSSKKIILKIQNKNFQQKYFYH